MRVLYAGQFTFVKGPSVVAETIARLAEMHGAAQFTWLCGEAHHESVRRLLSSVENRVRIANWKTQDDLRDLYDSHGILLFPSLFEGFGKVFLEAMARGLCVVASDEGGMHDLIRHGTNGFVAPVGDSARLAELVSALLTDQRLFSETSQAARKTALPYSWERAARTTLAFYERLLRWSAQRATADR
jgi:glycosyltransferase involved in cell wall biosynthesis